MAAGHLILNAATVPQGGPTMTLASFTIPADTFNQDVNEWNEDSDEDEESTHHTVPILPPPIPRSSARDICNLLNPVSGSASGSGGQ